MNINQTGSEIRKSFIDFFVEQKHTFVPSTSLVPGGDATLLFTNAGMVQFKDVFLGTDKRPYTRATNSQKCMRVAGKHNDLEDVGQDDYHHTFFEMLGNWSFGDYYKKEAITWAWQLLTDVWGLPKEKLYVTCFQDDQGNIPIDDEAANEWRKQPGLDPTHILFFGRKENFWEMAETGPCGPCSEIHIDRGEEFDNLAGQPHNCGVNGDCQRYLELWNNVFIQYNRISQDVLEPLPATHVDTGMGFERIVAVLQGVDSNYKIDLFKDLLDTLRQLTGDSEEKMYAHFTPYRVIADHARAAAFMIADGVVPGNIGRNYICRMIIRRAARFGSKLGLHKPFLAEAADCIISSYKEFYPELAKHRSSIIDHLTREEIRFERTVESGTHLLLNMLGDVKKSGQKALDGHQVFDLYATFGLPFEIARDIAREQGQDVDEAGFRAAMDEHRQASGGGKAIGKMDDGDVELYNRITAELRTTAKLRDDGVEHDPYTLTDINGDILSMVKDGQGITTASAGDIVEVLLPKTCFYVESGGQVSDMGIIRAIDLSDDGKPNWEIEVNEMRKPATGVIVHAGEVIYGHPKVGDRAVAVVDAGTRRNIMRNHTATHLLHAALQQVLGSSVRQAGSKVGADRLRFDFSHTDAMTREQIKQVEKIVNEAILSHLQVIPVIKSREEAIADGATALFGEKYGEIVRTISISPVGNSPSGIDHSYELCGGTHIENTSGIGIFLILSEASAAAGIRRIEAVTGKSALELIMHKLSEIKSLSEILRIEEDELPNRVELLLAEIGEYKKRLAELKFERALSSFVDEFGNIEHIHGVNLLLKDLDGSDKDTLAKLADTFREKYPKNGICVIVSRDESEIITMAAVTKDLIPTGIKAGDLVGIVSRNLGAGGGGAPHLAFGGGRDLTKLPAAFMAVKDWLNTRLQ